MVCSISCLFLEISKFKLRREGGGNFAEISEFFTAGQGKTGGDDGVDKGFVVAWKGMYLIGSMAVSLRKASGIFSTY